MARKYCITYAPLPRTCKRLLFALIFIPGYLILPGFALAQEPPRQEVDLSQFLQNLIPDQGEDEDYSELYESLYQLYSNPLDLNTATRDELASLFILSENQLDAFLRYRDSLGPFISIYELQAVPEFDLAVIYKLLPFVTIQPRAQSLKMAIRHPTQHFLMVRAGRVIEQQKGFTAPTSTSFSRYAGAPVGGFLRYRYARQGAYSFGFTMDKDAGERWWKWNTGRQTFGADFTSFHAQIIGRGRLKHLILGDFQMQAGQGLVFSAGFALGKGAESIRTIYRSTLGLKPYTSAMEANFFRGAAATVILSKTMELTTFYSCQKRDGTIDNPSFDPGGAVITSLPVSGYHRTETEREKHHNTSERDVGLHLIHRNLKQKGQVGLSLLHTAYNLPIQKREAEYNRFEFAGKQNFTAGLHGDYRWQNLHFSGEMALGKSGGIGALGGVIAGLGRKLDLSLLGRHYDKNFHSFYGNPFAENTRPINESGIYLGARYLPLKHWQVSCFYDVFRFSKPKFRVDQPSGGQDYFVHILWKPNKRWNAFASFHQKIKQQNAPESAGPGLARIKRNTCILSLDHDVPLKYATRTRIQAVDFSLLKISKSRGLAVAQDFSKNFSKTELTARIAWFHTDDYDSRLYMYEKDVLYAFSFPAYSEKGTRYYLMARYNCSKNMKVWIRWSQTIYRDMEKIGSGLSEIQGNKRSEIKVQAIYQL